MPLRGLAAACHPLPCLAVTGFAGGWAAAIGLPPGRVVLVMVAVLLGQLCVGWSNDALDTGRDRQAARLDKPISAGRVTRRAVVRAAVLAALACIAVSLALGLAAGTVHLLAVASALAYNLGLKSTPASPVPYALSFGLLPGVATWAAVGPRCADALAGCSGRSGDPAAGWPAAGVVAGAALLGVAAHFANTVPDAAADAVTGVRGLPQRLGPRRSLQVTAWLVAAAAVSLLTANHPDGSGPAWLRPAALAVLVAGAGLAAAVALLAGRPGVTAGRQAFRLTLVAVGLVVAGFLLSGASG